MNSAETSGDLPPPETREALLPAASRPTLTSFCPNQNRKFILKPLGETLQPSLDLPVVFVGLAGRWHSGLGIASAFDPGGNQGSNLFSRILPVRLPLQVGDEMGVVHIGQKPGMQEDPLEKGDGRLDPVDLILGEGSRHPKNDLLSLLSPGDLCAKQRGA